MSGWYAEKPEDILRKMDVTTDQGLSSQEAVQRLTQYGVNELLEKGGKSFWKILLEQLTGIMTVILIVSAVISSFLGDFEDALVIFAIVILNTILGFSQEYRAEKAMAALKKMSVPRVKVRRDGRTQEISARQVVPGDLVYLEVGNLVPADGSLVESVNLRIQESVLTGESQPVDKHLSVVVGDHVPLGDQHNRVFMGTIVSYGRGMAVVTETGMNTELGRIASMLQLMGQEATPLQRRLEQLARGLAAAALGIVGFVFALGVLRGEEVKLMFLTAISMAVAAVPEGLPAVVTITLALGAQRMLKRQALIRKLPAVETLGSVTVICSDKTGTLTENRITVTVLDVANHRLDLTAPLQRRGSIRFKDKPAFQPEKTELALLLAGGALCNDAVLEMEDEDSQSFQPVGDPTEGALVTVAAWFGFWKNDLEQVLPRVAELPFDSDRKRMTTVHQVSKSLSQLPASLQPIVGLDVPYLTFTKGAVDSLLDVTGAVWVDNRSEPITHDWRERIIAANNRLAQSGMRVLGVAFRPLRETQLSPHDPVSEDELIFLGMFGMIDPPRPEVKEAVALCRTAGIRPVMITGDHPLTAKTIAHELGISNGGKLLTGVELSKLSDQELVQVVDETRVYARVSPEHKLRIVDALQQKGHIVAMTGDGVNDAPALKRANIGVAMGITGTDVSKEASDMVLLDDNFTTIVVAVREGRVIYDNIRKFIKYTMTSNAGEIWVMLLAPFLGMPLPLLPLQILWVNLVTDGLPGLALGVEPAERNVMQRPPFRPKENIFGRGMGRDILWIGLLMGIVSLGTGFWYWRNGNPTWQTMVFTTLTLSQLGNALATRSNRDSLFRIGLFSNLLMLGAVLLTFALQLAVVYTPFLQRTFETVALSPQDLGISLALSMIVYWGVELQKWLLRRKS